MNNNMWIAALLFITVIVILIWLTTYLSYEKYILKNEVIRCDMKILGVTSNEKVIPWNKLPKEIIERTPVNTILTDNIKNDTIIQKKYKHKRYKKPKKPLG